jgi:ABC transport system ATP-binding/permease protein
MSEKILQALMQLFAIIANREQLTGSAKGIVVAFLRQQVSLAFHDRYLDAFDEYLGVLQGKASSGVAGKRIAANSVKVLKICTQINSELDQKQKYIVLVKLVEFAYSFTDPPGEQELEFIDTVASVFNISSDDTTLVKQFSTARAHNELPDEPHLLVIRSGASSGQKKMHLVSNETLEGALTFLNIASEGLVFVKYFGESSLLLNGQRINDQRVHIFSQGSVIRESRLQPVYYSDVIRRFLSHQKEDDLQFTVTQIDFFFPGGKQGLHPLTFSAGSGNLVGIMGGSGAGKSTLLNLLNGNLEPKSGEVLVNGINLHRNRKQLRDIIGYIPQDDLLMEELTVYQNLYYNTKLGLGHLSEEELDQQVTELLDSLGLSATRDLRVGDVLNKTLSGGQRKRLNIALELIRKPAILFVDEPTSGLSSLDSQNVMDLLKQLSLTGKLIFVVIHQPSSDIFKLFDKLLILDNGGYPIYYGNPSDSIIYFKRQAMLAGADESECKVCGNINSEQIFSIVENKVFDEFGHPTPNRRITPPEWYRLYEDQRLPNVAPKDRPVTSEAGSSTRPSKLRQLGVFIQRDVLSKIKNTQYLLINFLEAPVLAFVLAYFLKYSPAGSEYVFRENLNLPAYIFMCVIVALFMSLTVSAEEIIRDRKILKREEFLNLSRGTYLVSKILVQFTISAIQTGSFVLIGNYIFEIQGMFNEYWVMLFTVSCFGNLLGLNISSAFDSAVTIYILIPFLIIPQIILSGVMVKFENLNPAVTARTHVPIIGEVMASRWAYEALAVNQYKSNRYERNFFEIDKEISEVTYRKDFWMIKMNDLVDSLHAGKGNENKKILLKNELKTFDFPGSPLPPPPANKGIADKNSYESVKIWLAELRKMYINRYKELSAMKDQKVRRLTKTHGPRYLEQLREDHTNESLSDMLLATPDFEFIIEHNNRFVRRFRPVYMDGTPESFVRAQFQVSGKNIGGKIWSTWYVNITVIWVMTLSLMMALHFNVLRKLTELNILPIRRKRK